MRQFCTVCVLFFSTCLFAQERKSIINLGLELRYFPVDIEDAPQGPYHTNGNFYSPDFWRGFSFSSRCGRLLNQNWAIFLTGYARYNHLHWTSGKNFTNEPYFNQTEKRNFKYDIFVDFEKGYPLGKKSKSFLNLMAGIGLVNLNTKYEVTLRDTFPSGLGDLKHYEGNLIQFSPRVGIGYQYKKIRASVNTYVIEGHDLTGLTALWFGTSVYYEFGFSKK